MLVTTAMQVWRGGVGGRGGVGTLSLLYKKPPDLTNMSPTYCAFIARAARSSSISGRI